MTIEKKDTILVAVTLVLLMQFPEIKSHDGCDSVQYLNINDSGIIQCSFKDYVAITWHRSLEDNTIIAFHDGIKSGDGYDSGEYDIFPNGSLFIQHVKVEHDATYNVIKVISVKEALSAQYDIEIKTVVKPKTSYPVIDKCPRGSPLCLMSVYFDGSLNCVIENSRPPVDLRWISRSLGNDELLDSSYATTTYDNITYSSYSRITYVMSHLALLNMFVCQANSSPQALIVNNESVVVLDKVVNYEAVASAEIIHVEEQSSMKLPCSNKKSNVDNREMVIWKQLPKGHQAWFTIVFATNSSSWLTESYNPDFKIDGEGTLLLKAIQNDQEGLYVCIFSSGRKQDVALYDVITFVYPIPGYPVVEGCDHQQYCVLRVANGDVIKCSVIGIRPEVELEWIVFGDGEAVSFEDRRYSAKQNKQLFDVVLTSLISHSQSSVERATVACRVTRSDSHKFQISTTFDILFETVTSGQVDQQNYSLVIILAAAVLFLIAAVITTALIIKKRAGNPKRRKKQSSEADQEELSPMMHSIPENSQTNNGQRKEEAFIRQLKAKYEMLYDSVQPIPYIKDRMYCVDKVFVESGIEYLLKSADARQKCNWKQLESYHELLSESMTSSGRSLLEGEPGYGKSTITLQLAYDWCNSVRESPLSSIKILIFLRLRQLGGVKSIYQAIRRFILPKDSTLTEKDVRRIIEACESVVVVLDGYDEYPDQGTKETDICKIISKDIFRETKVLLTTRSFYLTKHRAPQYSRMRLIGLDESARDKYIRKAVVGDDDVAVENIKRKLQENPVLGDLCEVPLFFVMFAHITHENEDLQSFKSVTDFFRCMIKCFHSHMRNKMKEENVKVFKLMETKHSQLDKIAFKALAGKKQQIVWKREKLINSLGNTFYEQYVKVGILVEDEIVNVSQDLHLSDCTIEVRFYHKLFCEWYAAHYLSRYILKITTKTSRLLADIDPYDLQYLYRFACGISKEASDKIIKYLRKTEEGQKFTILCILEQEGETNVLLESVTDLVSEKVTVSGSDSRLLQRSTIQILNFASKKQIPIPRLCLNDTFKDLDDDGIILQSEIHFSCPLTLEKLEIITKEKEVFTKADFIQLIQHIQHSQKLKSLEFKGYRLPQNLTTTEQDQIKKYLNAKVLWHYSGNIYSLDAQSGHWDIVDLQIVRQQCTDNIHIQKTESDFKTWHTTRILETASKNGISISCVTLDQSLDKIDQDEMILTSGITLPKLLTLEKIHIETKEEEELTVDDVIIICTYAQQSKGLKEVSFGKCLLPLSFPSMSTSKEMINRNIKVTWCRYGYSFNFYSGLWDVDDVDTVRRLCSSEITIKSTDSKLLERCTIQLLKNASDNDIPIIRVYLEDCSPSVNKSDLCIRLDSGLSLPVLNSLQDLFIKDVDRTLTNEEFVAFLRYSSECTSLNRLVCFEGYMLPEVVHHESIPYSLVSRNIKVLQSDSTKVKRLKMEDGHWLDVHDVHFSPVDSPDRLTTNIAFVFHREFQRKLESDAPLCN